MLVMKTAAFQINVIFSHRAYVVNTLSVSTSTSARTKLHVNTQLNKQQIAKKHVCQLSDITKQRHKICSVEMVT